MELCRHETCVKYSGLGESCRELGGNEEALVKVIEEKKKKIEHKMKLVKDKG